jgi:2-iminobutanoate/2-iminopropanoate deaminase
MLFCSGQIGLDPATGELVDGVEAQAERALRNLRSVLDAAGLGFDDVAKTTVFLADMGDFATVNAIYARFMPDPPPARSTVQVAGLPKGALDDGPDPRRPHRGPVATDRDPLRIGAVRRRTLARDLRRALSRARRPDPAGAGRRPLTVV